VTRTESQNQIKKTKFSRTQLENVTIPYISDQRRSAAAVFTDVPAVTIIIN